MPHELPHKWTETEKFWSWLGAEPSFQCLATNKALATAAKFYLDANIKDFCFFPVMLDFISLIFFEIVGFFTLIYTVVTICLIYDKGFAFHVCVKKLKCYLNKFDSVSQIISST